MTEIFKYNGLVNCSASDFRSPQIAGHKFKAIRVGFKFIDVKYEWVIKVSDSALRFIQLKINSTSSWLPITKNNHGSW